MLNLPLNCSFLICTDISFSYNLKKGMDRKNYREVNNGELTFTALPLAKCESIRFYSNKNVLL